MDPTPDQMNPIHMLKPHFLKIHFIIILTPTSLGVPCGPFYSCFLSKILHAFPISSMTIMDYQCFTIIQYHYPPSAWKIKLHCIYTFKGLTCPRIKKRYDIHCQKNMNDWETRTHNSPPPPPPPSLA
jgi:hypothetical protein